MKKTFYTLSLLLLSLMAQGCGSDKENRPGEGHDNVSEEIKVKKDSEAYYLGRQAAQRVVGEQLTREQLHDSLLDTRAVISLLQRRYGDRTAADYQAGFVDAVKESGDTLANVLF